MVIDKSAPYGAINISKEAIASVAGEAASSCYGIVSLASSSLFGEKSLSPEDYAKGVVIRKRKDDYEVDVYVVAAYGVKVTEVLTEVQKNVAYVLKKTFNLPFRAVNVYLRNVEETK